MPHPTRAQVAAVLSVILTALAGVGFGIIVSDDGNGHHTVTVTVGQRPAAAVAVQDVHVRDESPPGVSRDELNRSERKQEELAHNDQLPIVSPDAAPQQRGCVSRFVRNYSSRRGVRPREWTLHYTVSHNTPGWGDVNAIVNLFNSPSAQASSNYVIDSEGHCAYIVRESDKAWTQAGGNPYAISVEVIAYGSERRYLEPAGQAKLDQVISDSARRWQIPLQRGAVSGCVPTRPGIIQHKDWGLCGGGHFDISPFPVDPVIASVKAWRAAHTQHPVTAADRRSCRLVHAYRARRRAHKPKTATGAAAFQRRLALVRSHGLACRDGKPVAR